MPADTSRRIFVNLPIDDLAKSVDFFTALGFAFDPQFTDETATRMIVNEDASVMLLVKARFQDFTTKAICDATTHTETILALSADSRAAVDDLVDKALAVGGQPANEPMDHGFMYVRSFHDVDGHLWEAVYMDPSAIQQ